MNGEPTESDEAGDPADALMQRGEYLRQLRKLELIDNEQREEQQSCTEYYDDLKHVDYDFLDFGCIGEDDKAHASDRLIIEQDKTLGKGGLCWDAAFILAEYLIANQNDVVAWKKNSADSRVNLIELGSGTGLCGLMLAKGMPRNVNLYLTDLPELQQLLRRNARRNYDDVRHLAEEQVNGDVCTPFSKQDEHVLWQGGELRRSHDERGARLTLGVLRWGDIQDMANYPQADVVIGADVVASLYDPVALAQTIHALCRDENSVVVTSYKERLSGPHQLFNQELDRLFEHVDSNIIPTSRNKNPNVRIIRATGKRIAVNVG